MEKGHKTGLGQNSKKKRKKKKPSQNGFDIEETKPGEQKSSNRNIFYKCHKNLFKRQISVLQGKGMKSRKCLLLCCRGKKTSNR